MELWRCCEGVIWKAAATIAEKFGKDRQVTVPEWQFRHGLDNDDMRYEAFPAVMQAAKGFDPDKGASFQTYAYGFILGRLRAMVVTEDALCDARSDASELRGIAEDAQASREPVLDMWHLLELHTDDVGPALAHLCAPELRQIRAWLDDVKDRALAEYPPVRWGYLRFYTGFAAMVDELPPEERRKDVGSGVSRLGPLQGVAILADGKRWDLVLPVRADLLRRRGLSERAVARALNMPRTTYQDMRRRMEDAGFTSERFTPDRAAAVVRGRRRGRPRKRR